MHGLTDRKRWIFDNITKKGILLDAGCMQGGGTFFYSKKATKSFGIDAYSEFIKIAKKSYPKIEFKTEKIEKTSFTDNYFDVIILGDVLEHISNENAALKEIKRIIKKDGELIITVPKKGLFSFIDIDNLILLAKKILRKTKNRPGYDDWHKHYSTKELKTILGNHGFKITKKYSNSLLLFPLASFVEYFSNLLFNKNNFFKKLALKMKDFDSKINYGFLAYNLFIKAKLEK